MLTAVVGVLLARLLALAGTLEQAAAALGTLAGHLHHQRHGEIALRPAGAGQEAPKPPGLDDQVPAALGADLLGHLVGHLDALAVQLLLSFVKLRLKVIIECREHLLPVHAALFHLVQLFLHLGGEGGVHDVLELVLHQAGDHLAQGGRTEGTALLHHILPVEDGGDGGGVGGGAANALLFQRPDEGGLGIAGRRLGEVLLLVRLLEVQVLPLLQIGQGGLGSLILIVLTLLVDSGKAGEFQLRVAGPEGIARRLGLNGYAVVDGRSHLAGQETAPNELVELILLAGQILLNLVGHQVHVGGTNGLVGVLSASLGLVVPGLGRIVLLAVAGLNKTLGSGNGLLGEAQGVGTHIGDQTHGALAGDVYALIELLGDRHSAGGGHVQFAAGLLLEGGGGEGRRGIAKLLLAFHLGHGEGSGGHFGHDSLGFLLAVQFHLLLPAVEHGLEAAQVGAHPLQVHLDGPVLLGLEGADLLLPLHHQAGCHRLHTAGRQATADLLPQQRRQLIAHDAVQNTPGLLSIHQVLVDGPGGGNGLVDHLFGDLVEGDPVGLFIGDVQKLLQVPGDGLALTVRVGGQIHLSALLGRLFQGSDGLLLSLDGLVVGLESVFHVHAQLALGQVPDVTHGRHHLITRSKVLADGLGLGRGLYNDQICLCCHVTTSNSLDMVTGTKGA